MSICIYTYMYTYIDMYNYRIWSHCLWRQLLLSPGGWLRVEELLESLNVFIPFIVAAALEVAAGPTHLHPQPDRSERQQPSRAECVLPRVMQSVLPGVWRSGEWGKRGAGRHRGEGSRNFPSLRRFDEQEDQGERDDDACAQACERAGHARAPAAKAEPLMVLNTPGWIHVHQNRSSGAYPDTLSHARSSCTGPWPSKWQLVHI